MPNPISWDYFPIVKEAQPDSDLESQGPVPPIEYPNKEFDYYFKDGHWDYGPYPNPLGESGTQQFWRQTLTEPSIGMPMPDPPPEDYSVKSHVHPFPGDPGLIQKPPQMPGGQGAEEDFTHPEIKSSLGTLPETMI